MALVEQVLTTQSIGLVLAEPIQGRGGIRTPPPQWLSDLAQTSRTHGALFALDEIQTGLGRTGTPFAGPALGVIPDLMCVGKALGGGFPISACVGSRQVMDAWGVSEGEAIHTQTFLGHPIGCAAASAVLTQIANGLPEQALSLGEHLSKTLRAAGFPCRGRGLMWGVSVSPSALEVSRRLLSRGFLALPAGMQGEVLCLTPPVCLTHPQWDAFLRTLSEVAQPGAALE